MNELRPDENGFRYVLMWMNRHIEKRDDAGLSYLIEWADFLRDSRDEIERLQAENAALRKDAERLEHILEATYQMAGVVDAPVRFLDALSSPCDVTQEQIDALLPVREDEFDEIVALRKDVERLDYVILNTSWIEWREFDSTFTRCQLMTQDEDENYIVLSGPEDRFFATSREAIDAAMQSNP